MSPLVRKRATAQRDLLEHFVSLGERAGDMLLCTMTNV